MNVLKIIGILIIYVIIALIILGFFLPKKQIIRRSISINANIDRIFELVNNIKNTEKWSHWIKSDDTINITYGNIIEGKGATYNWTGKKSAEGVYTITESKKNQEIAIDLDFKKQGRGKAIWTFKENGKNVLVEEKFIDDIGNNIIKRYLSIVFLRDIIGKAFENDLRNIKEIVEGSEEYFGYLMDVTCGTSGIGMDKSGDLTKTPQNHTKHCLEFCRNSGFGIMIKDKNTGFYKYIKFNDYGTELANKILDNSAREKGIKIAVYGIKNDDIIDVNEIREVL